MVEFHVCQSIYHWFKDCPHNVQGSNSKVSLFTQEVQKYYVQNVLGETLILAVLDSGCTKTVCRQEWLKYYIKGYVMMTERQYKSLLQRQS